MKIQRVNDEVRVLFDGLVPDAPGVEVRPMFGQRAAWVNGNMFMGTFEDRLVVRLPDDGRAELAAAGGERFEPMGRPMREYMMLPAAMHADPRGSPAGSPAPSTMSPRCPRRSRSRGRSGRAESISPARPAAVRRGWPG